ncbi:potassium transporter 1 [Prunus dulcis]|uniref:Potassium transporter 1 n=1 Tax=Prunus dulcis TaxID=3755 RepID=A0A4Y1RK60_PRUDU|nr:potassium transporter 1 [Prunus dulcis]
MNPSEELMEQGISPRSMQKVSYTTVLTLAYQSLGVVYGDLSTSPLYVYKTTFSGKLSLQEDDEEIFGVLSFIFWTFTLIALCKYVFIVMLADDNGEGGTFALYSLLCRHARLSILPNQEITDEKLSEYVTEGTTDTLQSSALKLFFDKHPRFRKGLLVFVLFGTCMAIGDGVLTPAISVSGIKLKFTEIHDNYVVIISCVLLVGLFSLQHHGTHRVAFMFAPIVTAWLLCISGIGIYNIFHWNRRIFHALSPVYMLKFLRSTGVEGWVSLAGVVLSITELLETSFLRNIISGVEAMFANLGHFSSLSIKMAFTLLVYPSLVISYMGEAAFLSKHHEDIQRSFYKAIPEAVFWPVFIIATFASVVGSQAVISATFSIISQCCALKCFPRVKIVHTSSKIYGQIYIPEVNWMAGSHRCNVCDNLLNGSGNDNCLEEKDTKCSSIFNAVWIIELIYIAASISKIPEGGWIPVVLSLIFMGVTYIWNYGTMMKHQFDVENKVSINRIVCLGPSLGMVRVPGIGLVYTNLVTGIPPVFGHFVTNLPAFHEVLIFVSVKSVQVPHISGKERLLISRVGPKECGMFRCIVRYGYKDLQQETCNFENILVSSILQFVETEEECPLEPVTGCSREFADAEARYAPDHTYVDSNDEENMETSLSKDESLRILEAKESGVTYILGHSHAKAKKSSSFFKKVAIDIVYAFLRKNCREPDVVLNVPHTSLLEVDIANI